MTASNTFSAEMYWQTDSINTSLCAALTLTCLMHKGWRGPLFGFMSPGRSQDCPKQLSHPMVCPPPASHTFPCANMRIPPLSCYVCLRCRLRSQATSTWWLNVPVFSLSLKQPEKGTMLCYITGSNLYIPSKNSHFIQRLSPFLTSASLRHNHALWALRLVVQPCEWSVFNPLELFSFNLYFCLFFLHKDTMLSCKRLPSNNSCAEPSNFLPYSHVVSINIPSI